MNERVEQAVSNGSDVTRDDFVVSFCVVDVFFVGVVFVTSS